MDISVGSTFWLLWIMVLWILCISFCVDFHFVYVFISLGCIHSRIVWSNDDTVFNLFICQTVIQSSCTIFISTSSMWEFQFLQILSNACYYLSFLLLSSSCVCCRYLIYITLVVNDMNIFLCTYLATNMCYLLWKNVYSDPDPLSSFKLVLN